MGVMSKGADRRLVLEELKHVGGGRTVEAVRSREPVRCSFCKSVHSHENRMVMGSANICEDCVRWCAEALGFFEPEETT